MTILISCNKQQNGFIESTEEVCFRLTTFFVSVEMVTRQHLPQQCSSENHQKIRMLILIPQDILNYLQKFQMCGSLYVAFLWLQHGEYKVKNSEVAKKNVSESIPCTRRKTNFDGEDEEEECEKDEDDLFT